MAANEPDMEFLFPNRGRRRKRSVFQERDAPMAADVRPAPDLAHANPRMSEHGDLSVSAPSTPGAAFQDVSDEVWALPEIEAFTVRAVETVLRRRGIEMSDMAGPDMEIAVPAIEAMRYSPLREEIATLIASSMDANTRDAAHPAFLSILQQLTRDEVRILQMLPAKGQFVPMAHLYVTTSRDQVRIIQRNVLPGELGQVCEKPGRMAGYVDNLMRLQLVHEPDGVPLPDASFYSALTKQEACQAVLRDRNLRRRSRVEKRILSVTDFGETFRTVCLG